MKSNAEVQKDVYEELRWDSRVTEEDIGVSASNGIVTLTGTIPSYAEKWAAEEATRKIPGVAAVINQIDVHIPGLRQRDDFEIAAAATEALQWNVWIPPQAVKIILSKGWITLTGEVPSEHAKQCAEDEVKLLSGVKGVTNDIQVRPPKEVKDIQLEIKKALKRRAEAQQIDIVVQNGEVFLSGKVHSWAERQEAEWAALQTAGVRSVQNNVTVVRTA